MGRRVLQQIRTVDDAHRFATRRLPKFLVDMIDDGSTKEVTLRNNLAVFDEVTFQPRAAVNVGTADLSTTILGHRVGLPIIVAPTGNIRVFHRGGEPAVARAAGSRGVIHAISCFAGHPIEEVAAAATGPIFFNLYFVGGRDNAEKMLARASAVGCAALVVTVDWAAAHQKERNDRRGLSRPARFDLRSAIRFGPAMARRPSWTVDFLRDGARMDTPMWLKDGKPASIWEVGKSIADHVPTWNDIRWLRERWDGPIIFKGLLHVDDARRAVDEGLEGIVVSNHGGRALDSSPASLRVLPEIVDAVDDRLEVYFDSGIRRGGDVVKAIALGARACLIGRSYVWAHAAAGGDGVAHILDHFRDGMTATLGSLGCPSVAALDRSYVAAPWVT